MFSVAVRILIDIHGSSAVSNWIDKLRSDRETQKAQERREQEWQLHCAELIRAKAPDLWAALVEQIASDVREINATIHGVSLEFNDHNSKTHFDVSNPSLQRNFSAYWRPDISEVGLEFRNRPDPLSSVHSIKDQIGFAVVGQDVHPRYGGFCTISSISEWLIKRIL